jgi:uncharacterized FlgJ-related protein
MTDKLIFDAARADGMPVILSNLIVAQSKHETTDVKKKQPYTSNAFVKNNNAFGYKAVKGAKWQLGPGITSSEKDPYANYASVENSVHELTDWIKRRQKQGKFPSDLNTITEPVQYANLLKACGYFGDPVQNYISGLTKYNKDFSTV